MKQFLSIFLAVCLLLSATACAAAQTQSEPAPSSESTEPPLYPMTVTDQGGRSVTIPAEPQRIVSSYYIATSALIAMGLQQRIVGVDNKPERRAIYRLSAPELLSLTNVGTGKELDLEACLSLNPDLVILPLRLKTVVPQLEELEIPVLLVSPESGEQLLEMTDLIARAANVTERAQALRDFISAQEARLEQITGQAPTVYLGGNSDFLSTAGGKMYQSDLIALAGGENVAAGLEEDYWAQVSYEHVLAWDPEFIILAADAAYTVEDILTDPNLADCRAVREGKVFHMPNQVESWDSPIPGSILGSLWLASILHPQEITPEETNEIITSFYQQFYGFPYEAE